MFWRVLRFIHLLGFHGCCMDVKSGKKLKAEKVFKNRRESPWDGTLNEPVPRLIWILVSYWAQKFYLCLIGGQNLSRCCHHLFARRSSAANSTFRRTCLAPVGVIFSRGVFSFQWKMHQLKKSDCGLIEGKFINTRILLGMFMRNREPGCSVYVTPVRPTCQARAGDFKVIYASLLLVISPQWHNSIERNWKSTLAELHKQA